MILRGIWTVKCSRIRSRKLHAKGGSTGVLERDTGRIQQAKEDDGVACLEGHKRLHLVLWVQVKECLAGHGYDLQSAVK
jgi:hypothetical protein